MSKTLPYRVTLSVGGVCIENKYFSSSKEACDWVLDYLMYTKVLKKKTTTITYILI